MANLINIDAEVGANMIGDDTSPTLAFSNTSTGPGLQTDTFVATSTATIAALNSAAITGSTARPATAANATIIAFNFVGSSVASGGLFKLSNLSSFVSTTTIKVNTAVAANTGAIRIVKPDGTFGYIPVYADGDVTAVAV